MTFDEAFNEIYAGILEIWPDRKGGGLTIAETALVLRQKFGGASNAKPASVYEVVRRSLAKMDVPVKNIGSGKRVMIFDLAKSLARMVCTDDISPPAARRRSGGFKDHKLDLTRTGPRGAVTPSTVGFATRFLTGGPWPLRPLRPLEEEPVFVSRIDFASDLAAVRYIRRVERIEAFWKAVLVEINKLEAAEREASSLTIALPPRKREIQRT